MSPKSIEIELWTQVWFFPIGPQAMSHSTPNLQEWSGFRTIYSLTRNLNYLSTSSKTIFYSLTVIRKDLLPQNVFFVPMKVVEKCFEFYFIFFFEQQN